jgi:hypothetical protein
LLIITGIDDPIEQKQCLDLGKEAGLNVAVITKSVVEHIRNTGVVSYMASVDVICWSDDPVSI